MSNNSANNRLLKNTILLYARMLVVLIVSLYTTRVVLQVLGVTDYGIYNVVCGFVSMFSILNSTLNTATNRFYNYSLGGKDYIGMTNVYNASLRIQVVIIIVLIVLMETFGLWYINNKMVIPDGRLIVANSIFQFSIISTVLVLLQIPYSAAILAYEKMDYYAIVSVIDAFIKLTFVIILKFVDYDHLLFYGLLTTIVSLMNFLMYFVYCKINFSELVLTRNTDKIQLKKMLSFSIWSFLDPLTTTITGQGSNMVLNLFFGPIVNAAYGVTMQLRAALNSFTTNLSVSFRPQIIQSYSSGNLTRTKNLVFSMTKFNYMLQLMLIIPLLFEIEFILRLWLGSSYPVHTVVFARIVLIYVTLNCFITPINTVMMATGKIRKLKIINMMILCLVIPIGYTLFKFDFPPQSIFLSMLTLTIVNILASIKIMLSICEFIKLKEYIRNVIFPLAYYSIVILIIPAILVSFLEPSIWRFMFLIVIVIPEAFIFAYKFIMNAKEKEIVISMFQNVFRRLVK